MTELQTTNAGRWLSQTTCTHTHIEGKRACGKFDRIKKENRGSPWNGTQSATDKASFDRAHIARKPSRIVRARLKRANSRPNDDDDDEEQCARDEKE